MNEINETKFTAQVTKQLAKCFAIRNEDAAYMLSESPYPILMESEPKYVMQHGAKYWVGIIADKVEKGGGGMMMNQTELDAIRNRTEKATEGPWEVCNGTDVFTKLGAINNDGVQANQNDGWYISRCNEGATSVGDDEIELSFNEQNANAHFISKAREDVPKLLAEVERLKSAITYACEMMSIGEGGKANDKLTESLGVPYDFFEEDDE